MGEILVGGLNKKTRVTVLFSFLSKEFEFRKSYEIPSCPAAMSLLIFPFRNEVQFIYIFHIYISLFDNCS